MMISIIFLVSFLIILFYISDLLLKTRNKNILNKNYYKNENHIIKPPFPIDIVYTWKGENVSNNTRESYNYELKYSLRSIDQFAPWANKIYILVDSLHIYPSWINKNNDKIILVSTSETFPDKKYLPNSNSNAIETTITRIPNLSEYYIYFCDDIFLGRPTFYTDFFTYDGKAIIDNRTVIDNNILKNNDINILNIKFPPTVNRFYPHIPIPQIKSIVNDFYNKYPDYIEWIRNTKLRKDNGTKICDLNNLNYPCQQIHYPICKHMYSKNKAVLTDNRSSDKFVFISNYKMYIKGYSVLFNLFHLRPLFFCINDDEKDPNKRIQIREDMLYFFNEYYSQKASFEL